MVECWEWRTTPSVFLTVAQRDALNELVPSLRISPTAHTRDHYDLTPGSTVGIVRIGDLSVQIEPKIGPAKVIALSSLAFDHRAWKDPSANLASSVGLVEALTTALATLTRQALRSGLLQGYRSTDDVLATVKGRIRFAAQVQQRQGLPLPVSVTHDDYTHDVLEHQLIRAAAVRLGQMRVRSPRARQDLTWLRLQLDGVADHPFSPTRVPEPHWSRINERYRPAVGLARLILAGMSLESRAGIRDAMAFLIDMNTVFEDFVRVSLRDRLRLDSRTFPDGNHTPRLYLDRDRRWVPLKPDPSWWDRQRNACRFVGDCKYKRPDSSIPNADVYQMHAYLTALNLPAGLMVYATTDRFLPPFSVVHGGPRIEIRQINLADSLDSIAEQMDHLAETVRAMAGGILSGTPAMSEVSGARPRW